MIKKKHTTTDSKNLPQEELSNTVDKKECILKASLNSINKNHEVVSTWVNLPSNMSKHQSTLLPFQPPTKGKLITYRDKGNSIRDAVAIGIHFNRMVTFQCKLTLKKGNKSYICVWKCYHNCPLPITKAL